MIVATVTFDFEDPEGEMTEGDIRKEILTHLDSYNINDNDPRISVEDITIIMGKRD